VLLFKCLTKFPSEIELITAGLPSLKFYRDNCGLESLYNGLKLEKKFEYDIAFGFENKKLDIIVDTREQTPFKFIGHNIVNKKLEFGDYALDGKENLFAIERKSLMDFISSFFANIERVEKEFARAHEVGAHLIVVCEETIETAMSFHMMPRISKYTKIRPEMVFNNVRALCQKYNCQFVFCDGRRDAVNTTEKIFRYIGDISKIDIQYYKKEGAF
jgi:ERCC4-type nuclease